MSQVVNLALVEAGGIEPPSRDTSMKASTCVVERLCLARRTAYRQGCASNQPGAFFNPLRARHGKERSGIATDSRASPADPLSQDNLI